MCNAVKLSFLSQPLTLSTPHRVGVVGLNDPVSSEGLNCLFDQRGLWHPY